MSHPALHSGRPATSTAATTVALSAAPTVAPSAASSAATSLFVTAALIAAVLLLPVAPAVATPAEDTAAAEIAYSRDDVVSALRLLRRAADAGHAPAQARLGDILDAAEEDTLALEYYRKAAAQRDPAGEFGLGRMYDKGEGVARDPVEALRWYRLAADQGHANAARILAGAYRGGRLGLTPSPAEAATWEQRAAQADAATVAAAARTGAVATAAAPPPTAPVATRTGPGR